MTYSKISAKLYFVYGAMGSAKSAQLLMQAFNLEERGRKILCIKPRLDTRDQAIWSRVGIERECITMEDFRAIPSITHLDAILVDECQFLTAEEVQYLSDIVDYEHVSVYCYGLRTDFQGNLFEGSAALFALADEIRSIKTVCHCGQPVVMNARLVDGHITKTGEQIECGTDNYISLCRRCYKDEQLT